MLRKKKDESGVTLCARCGAQLSKKQVRAGATVCGNVCPSLQKRLEQMRANAVPPLPVTESEYARSIQLKAARLLRRFPNLEKYLETRLGLNDNPLTRLLEILDTPVGKPLPGPAHRWLQDWIVPFLENGAKPAELGSRMGFVAGAGKTALLELQRLRIRDESLLHDMLTLTALGATAEQAATMVLQRWEAAAPAQFQKYGIQPESLVRKYYEFPSGELNMFLREMGEDLTPDDVQGFVAQFPLDAVPDLVQKWRNERLLPKTAK